MNSVGRFVEKRRETLHRMSARFSTGARAGGVQGKRDVSEDSVELGSTAEEGASFIAPFNQGRCVREERMNDSTSGIGWENMGIKGKKLHRLTAVCLGLLCALLLTTITALCIHYNGVVEDTMEMHSQLSETVTVLIAERDQLQINYSALIAERDQLQMNYSALITERDQLQKNYNTIIAEGGQLQINYNALIAERDQLQKNYNALIAERDQLQMNYSAFITERDQLQMKYSALIEERDQLQMNYSALIAERDQLQINYSTLVAERDQLQMNYSSLAVKRDQLQMKYSALIAERDQLQMKYSALIEERDQLQVKYSSIIEERDQLQMNYSSLIAERYQLQINYSAVIAERYQLQINYSAVIAERDQLQMKYSTLIEERDQLQKNYSAIITERDQLQKRLEPPCSPDWKEFQSRLYFPSAETKTWGDSRQYCTARGGDLVTIKNREEQVFVNRIMKKSHFWIGLSDARDEGSWKWVDGETLTTGFWKSGEPNNYGSDEDCATSEAENDPLKNWNDMPCNIERKWVCERSACH